jgi:hypothetical protein
LSRPASSRRSRIEKKEFLNLIKRVVKKKPLKSVIGEFL